MDGDAPASLKRVVKEMRYCVGGAENEDTAVEVPAVSAGQQSVIATGGG